jgi:transposase-like protein
MSNSNVIELKSPSNDVLGELLKEGARQLLAKAVEAELSELLEQHHDERTAEDKRAVVRNGHLPERTIQTGLGELPVKIPKVRDRSGQGVKFNSQLVPPYLKRAKHMEELIPWLYLKGISTGEMQPALGALLGEGATGLSAGTVSRLKQCWEADYDDWRKRDLSTRRYVYIWADGIYSNVRLDDRLCLLVIMGSDDTGRKEVLAIVDGYRESEASWVEVIEQLESQGLSIPPKLAIGDGALGFWKAVAKKWPTTRTQRCWVHKTANVLNKVPKPMQPKIKEALHDIWMAETRDGAHKAFDGCVKRFEGKYPGAMKCLEKDKESMLAFYDFPAKHWQHIRTTNPIESVFATVRLRTTKTKNCGSRKTTLSMAWKLMTTAQNKWQRLRGYNLLADVVEGVKFKDGERVETDQIQGAPDVPVHQI